jgi:hypothetical protein
VPPDDREADQGTPGDQKAPGDQRAPGESSTEPALRPLARESRPRWRLTVARDEQVAELSERETVEALVEGFVGAGLPLAMSGAARPKPRVALAVPLPRGATSEAELVELHLAERLPVDDVRRRVVAGLPAGITLQAIEDEWIGAGSLSSRVAAVVYRVDVDAGRPQPAPEETIPSIRLVEWDAETGRGTLALRFERDAAGRLGRPIETVESLGLGLRVIRLVRVSVELPGE